MHLADWGDITVSENRSRIKIRSRLIVILQSNSSKLIAKRMSSGNTGHTELYSTDRPRDISFTTYTDVLPGKSFPYDEIGCDMISWQVLSKH